MTTDERLDAIRKRAAERTPGKWGSSHEPRHACARVWADAGKVDICEMISTCADETLIAHAPEDIDYLLADNDRLRAEVQDHAASSAVDRVLLEEARAEIDRLRGDIADLLRGFDAGDSRVFCAALDLLRGRPDALRPSNTAQCSACMGTLAVALLDVAFDDDKPRRGVECPHCGANLLTQTKETSR